MKIMNTECLSHKDHILRLIVERLGRCSIDFTEKMNFIRASRRDTEVHSAAGVLLLLHYTGDAPAPGGKKSEFIFQLIKRSSKVAQAGDLSCPGGLLHSFWDPLLAPLISRKIIPLLRADALKYALLRNNETFRMINLFLTNAVRESWEETGLSPWNILFLGALPSYSLLLFRRTIFPLVGFVKRKWHFSPSSEVEGIVEIPLMSFFDDSNYGIYHVETSKELKMHREHTREFPCLITYDNQGNEEILWGATFYIIMNFLKIVLKLEIPDLHSKRVINRTLGPEYLTGKPR